MPHQRHVLDVALEYDIVNGQLRPAYRVVVVLLPRQSGKTTLILPVTAHRGTLWPVRRPQRILYTAQHGKDAREKWLEHVELLEGSPLAPRMDVRESNGQEVLRWTHTRSTHSPTAPTAKAGHGKTLDLGVIDEAWSLEDYRVEQAMRPAMSTRSDAQLWVISTAGTDASEYLLDKVRIGREAARDERTDGVAYFEWSAPDDVDLSDESTWHTFMPALGHTVDLDVMRAEFEDFAAAGKLGEFERAYGNRFTNVGETVIPVDRWNACAPRSTRPFPGLVDPVALSIDVAEDRAHAAIGAADAADAVEVIEHREGTWWLVDRVVDLVSTWSPQRIVIDQLSPARSLVPRLRDALRSAGHDPARLVMLTNATEHAAACGSLYDAVVEDRLRHLDQPVLNAAVMSAGRRSLGDSWAWSRSKSSTDITPLVAVTLARWAFTVQTATGAVW